MMGVQPPRQGSLFHYGINIDKRVRSNHPLRRVRERIDFDFIYEEVSACYGHNGNVSVPPPVILKLMLLLVFYNVRSERELMDTLPERLDWLWFLGYDLDSEIPNHSVLSKARAKWGAEVFRSFFERIVLQCVEVGLVDGSKVFIDSSLVEADASNKSVIDTKSLGYRLRKDYETLEARLEEQKESADASRARKQNDRFVSATDPDAAIVNRGTPKLCYQVHRTVDRRAEIITATEATPGDVNEAHLMMPLVESHGCTTGAVADTVVADSKYGTIDNFLACRDRGLQAHMPVLKEVAQKQTGASIFSEKRFQYDPEKDHYLCPAGAILKPKSLHIRRQSRDYGAPKKVCDACPLRAQCTTNKTGRTIKRHLRQDELDRMRQASRSVKSKRDIRTRQHLMERSFARSKRYGYDRARWRGLWRMRIQEYLTCAIQNIQALLKYRFKPGSAVAAKLTAPGRVLAAMRPVLLSIPKSLGETTTRILKLTFTHGAACVHL